MQDDGQDVLINHTKIVHIHPFLTVNKAANSRQDAHVMFIAMPYLSSIIVCKLKPLDERK